jgi:hypothetical protein
MRIAYRYVEAANLLVTILDGDVAAAEVLEFAHRQVADPNFSRAQRRLTDARTAGRCAITDDDSDAISAIYRAAVANVRVKQAIVGGNGAAPSRSTDGSHTNGVTTIMFNDIDTAIAWLDLGSDTVLATITDIRSELRDR